MDMEISPGTIRPLLPHKSTLALRQPDFDALHEPPSFGLVRHAYISYSLTYANPCMQANTRGLAALP